MQFSLGNMISLKQNLTILSFSGDCEFFFLGKLCSCPTRGSSLDAQPSNSPHYSRQSSLPTKGQFASMYLSSFFFPFCSSYNPPLDCSEFLAQVWTKKISKWSPTACAGASQLPAHSFLQVSIPFMYIWKESEYILVTFFSCFCLPLLDLLVFLNLVPLTFWSWLLLYFLARYHGKLRGLLLDLGRILITAKKEPGEHRLYRLAENTAINIISCLREVVLIKKELKVQFCTL